MYNPIRRNKKIGKTQGGRVIDGRAEEKWSRSWFLNNVYARLSESDEKWQVFRENPSRDFFHPCAPEEYTGVLNQLPEQLTRYVKAIILPRMPKEDAALGIEARMRSECIIINPFPTDLKMKWNGRPAKSTLRHMEPWCANWSMEDGAWVLTWTRKEIKRYFLFHLFLHEIGHINQPWFHSGKKREEFAEQFALEWAKKLGQL